MTIRTLSRYELLDEIGRGNMGVVYRARDPVMDRTVAIKVIRPGFSLDERKRLVFLERFHREAQIAGTLGHPHIIAVHDFGDGDEPYIVMGYFPGISLSALAEQGPLQSGLVFEAPRHGEWRFRPEQIESLLQRSETELELRTRTRGESETLRFTFLRPALEEAALRDYRERILGR